MIIHSTNLDDFVALRMMTLVDLASNLNFTIFLEQFIDRRSVLVIDRFKF